MKKLLQSGVVYSFFIWGWTAVTAQLSLVPEWKILDKGSFVASHCYNNFSVAANKQYMAVVSGDAGFGNVNSNAVKISNDSGKTWRDVRYDKGFNIDSAKYTPLPGYWLKRFYSSVARPTKDLILVLASESWKDEKNPFPGYYGTLYPYILRSVDEGKTWERIEIQNPSVTCDKNILSMADEKVGYLISGVPVGTPNGYALVYKTTDGGKTWNILQTPFSADYVSQIQAISDKQLIIATNDSLFMSDDGGESWITGKTVPHNRYYTFKNLINGYCTGGAPTGIGDQQRTTAYKTTDGAKTWTVLLDTLSSSVSAGDVISFYDDNYGLLFARDSYWETRNGGKSWVPLPLPYGSGYRLEVSKAVSILDSNRFFGMTAVNMFFATGKSLLKPPIITFLKENSLRYSLQWNSINGAKQYRVQVAKEVPEFDILYLNYDIFDTQDTFLDTTLSTTNLALPLFDYKMNYFARVMGIGDSLNSEWSQPVLERTEDKTPLPKLNLSVLVSPIKDTVLPSTHVTFHWAKDSRATQSSLKLTTVGNYPAAFDDKIAQNTYRIYSDSITQTLQPNTKYYWYVISWGNGFDSTGSVSSSFRTGNANTVENQEIQADNFSNTIELSPQPTDNQLHITGNINEDAKVEIYSITGIKITDAPFSRNLDIRWLDSGIYILRIGLKNKLFVKM